MSNATNRRFRKPALSSRLLLLICPILLAGCSDSDDADPGTDLVEAAALWNAAGISSYSVRQARSCFCGCPRSFTVHVTDDQITGVSDVEVPEGWPFPPDVIEQQAIKCARTVPELFEYLAQSVETADHVVAEYDQALGYPTTVYVDEDFMIADEEQGWDLSELEAAEGR